ncbi:hypothetical protein CcaverHIS002_0506060 [Cutaneotrichosporon cavernicola]|uniref:B-related factor 1 n=1 Tax=Cutaneotrichosporon cavernicola TaxID=279322 RepID=A0AA48QX51_9TREE|nr:uncharacterized protein CcaverHIS019_0506590 [Cutaneotrichosporon cavernicola]BEI85205.1 hypothetical protein CcaverHIS002_0506060 [Cutaneotrichosporon cavernicola]BEI93031.1 hypothetical protein CcaverHIS019_0506590 [Cutaneotrichosporon cavernicola]BEJ00807.1 hypothetical protein CcaverHIS631_0506640 [Cutaneotrichosporon cavernicola]BEJ08574.1 hypothetical protein CcaverHIS641_0506680 [Cutaneotrichosporon cavernicola]
MAPPKQCPSCGGREIATDYALGVVLCQSCGLELEKGILVSEVGFTEGAGGRMHVQGTFVSNHSTGINSFRGHGPTSENIKEEGRKRIQMICNQMGILPSVQRGSQRFYSLAVDNKFNRGRRTDYVVASCIYLYSRFEKDALMLIDFSERLQINVYELGATYLKLRAALNLDQVLPEIDPAVYNIRFANRLDFGNKATMVAREASRLVKRFKADWMTAGRRPAGICGACIVIASRMNDFLRTPEEVAQVVKVSPQTIKKRLQEFAQTAMASKSVAEWRSMTDAELEAVNKDELPPIIKEQRAREERKRRRETAFDESSTKPNTRASSRASSRAPTPVASPGTPQKRRRLAPKDTESVPLSGDAAADAALAEVALDIGDEAEEGEEDTNLEELSKEDYVGDIQKAGDDSELARNERRIERRRLFRGVKAVGGDDDDEELDELAADADEYDDNVDAKEDGKEESAATSGGFKDLPDTPSWDDKEAVYAYIEANIFGDEGDLLYATPGDKTARIERWLRGREPKDVISEMRRVQWARHKREYDAKQSVHETMSDIDDDELENIYVMEDGEQAARARMWLSHNARWLEEDKERQIKKAALAEAAEQKRAGRPPRKSSKRQKRTAPFASAREAIDNFASTKKFSSRINMDAIRRLDAGEEYDLQSMPDDDDKDDKIDDKVDDKVDDADDDDEDFEFDIPPGQLIEHKDDTSDEED